ncbi:hypothetical protein B0I37DRAFT_366064 [Chaetomium sp. MPI-CAGE-AT-0009]|nr:hypothetical protein B0I37DRAFT_366064 [Chaetomium sp. MPI-CAGE-AT-0009]
MEFPISPQPSPPGSSLCIRHIHDILKRLTRHRLGDAFEGLLDLGDEMHDMVDDFWSLGDLHLVNRLLTSIVHHSAYGIYEHVDQVIHSLLLLAIHTCDRLRKAQPPPTPDRVVWLSSTQSEINDHLEVYRNFLGHITSCPSSTSSRDPNLQSARELLQKLHPRINGLSHWTRPADVRAKTDAVRRSHTRALRPSTQRQRSGITKPSSPPPPQLQPPKPVAVFMPTPPSQSGDVEWGVTVPTIPVHRTGRVESCPVAPSAGPPSHTMGRDDCRVENVDGLADEMARVLMSPPASVGVDGIRGYRHETKACTGMMHGGVGASNGRVGSMGAFRLRPEHSCSPRCCPFRGR